MREFQEPGGLGGFERGIQKLLTLTIPDATAMYSGTPSLILVAQSGCESPKTKVRARIPAARRRADAYSITAVLGGARRVNPRGASMPENIRCQPRGFTFPGRSRILSRT